MALSHPPHPGTHIPLGSHDTDCHDDKGTEAAGTDARQHHEQGDEGLTAEAKAALAVRPSCRDRARVAEGPSSPASGGPLGPPLTRAATRRTREGPWQGQGSGTGGGTCSRDKQKGQTYQAKGAANQAGVRLGTGGHVQPPTPPHTSGRNPSEGADLTVGLWSGAGGGRASAGVSLALRGWSGGALGRWPWAGAGRGTGAWQPLLSALLDPRQRQGWGCSGLGGWCFMGKGMEPMLRPLGQWEQWPENPGGPTARLLFLGWDGGGCNSSADQCHRPSPRGWDKQGPRRGEPWTCAHQPPHCVWGVLRGGSHRHPSCAQVHQPPRIGGEHCPQVIPEPYPQCSCLRSGHRQHLRLHHVPSQLRALLSL